MLNKTNNLKQFKTKYKHKVYSSSNLTKIIKLNNNKIKFIKTN